MVITFDEERAKTVFSTLATAWSKKYGFFANLIAPQQKFLPHDLRSSDPRDLANFLFFQGITMRGGINSDDACRFSAGLWRKYKWLFDPETDASESAIQSAMLHTASSVHEVTGGRQGRLAGALSMNLREHVMHWRENMQILRDRYESDARNLFVGGETFEDLYIQHGDDLNGMRRKIYSLVALWFQEFELIKDFTLPLVVDFHCLRLLFQLEIVKTEMKRLGEGTTERAYRKRPESMWEYMHVRASEKLVNTIKEWSLDFLRRVGLRSYDVSHGLWYLSRELCSGYYGNKSRSKVVDGHSITEYLVSDNELDPKSSNVTWPRSYRDPCRHCPVEDFCTHRISAGPYYNWGAIVFGGKHFKYPYRQALLDPKWPVHYRSGKSRKN